MAKLRPTLATACLAIVLTCPLAAQEEPAAPAAPPIDTTADVLVLDHDFASGAEEFARVFLESGQVYRGELNSADVTLEIRSLGGRIAAPRVYPLLGPESSSEASVVELYPDHDLIYEIRPVTGRGSGIGTRLRLYRDVRASHRRAAVLARPGWGIGFEVGTGWHSGFAQSNGSLPASAAEPHAGTDVEACFSARAPRGAGVCVFGIGYQSQVGAPSILWFYTEPRIRLIGRGVPGRSDWELGALFRFGLGSIERTSTTPWILAPGAYVARQIRSNDHGGGWSIQGSYSHAFYTGFRTLLGSTGVEKPHGDRLTFGLGWYQ